MIKNDEQVRREFYENSQVPRLLDIQCVCICEEKCNRALLSIQDFVLVTQSKMVFSLFEKKIKCGVVLFQVQDRW